MKRITLTILALCMCISAFALTLNWSQLPNVKCTLYSSTNLFGEWTPFLENASPPVEVDPIQQTAFFTVMLQTTNLNICIFTNAAGPNAQGIIPCDINSPNFSYASDGHIWIWDTNDYQWK